jgi:hypothetical protein
MAIMTTERELAMPGWAYAALLLLAIFLFAVSFYLEEHSQADGQQSPADAARQRRITDRQANFQPYQQA